MNAAKSPDQEHSEPWPPRFWWLKRGVVIVIVGILLVLGLRLWWGWTANHQFEMLVADAHDRGEPILLGDFAAPAVPDDQNAADSLLHAAAAIEIDSNANSFLMSWDGTPLTPADARQVNSFVSANPQFLQDVRRAYRQKPVDWKIPLTRPLILLKLSHLNGQRNVAEMTKAIAMRDHIAGDDSSAVELFQTILRQSDAVDAGPSPQLVSHLVAMGIRTLDTDLIRKLAPDLRIGQSNDKRARLARPQQIQDLIRTLLDDHKYRDAAVRAMSGERMMQCDMFSPQGRPGLVDIPRDWIIDPAVQMDLVRAARRTSQMIAAFKSTEYKTAKALIPALQTFRLPIEQAAHPYRTTGAENRPDAHEVLLEFHAIVERQTAAVALAIRLYRVEHGDTWPRTINELVPRYLNQLPVDPMSDDGKPLLYHPDSSPPVIYSVGENGVDDGGNAEDINQSAFASPSDWVFELTEMDGKTKSSSNVQPNQ